MDLLEADVRAADRAYVHEAAILPSAWFDVPVTAPVNKGTMLILRGIKNQLDGPSALKYARHTGYVGKVLDVSGETGVNSAQTIAAINMIRSDPSITALYGFSGGGYNVLHILDKLTEAEEKRLKTVVILGAPQNPRGLYEGAWELVYRTDPPGGHMDGPRALLAETDDATTLGVAATIIGATVFPV
jgi:hypothetical protein